MHCLETLVTLCRPRPYSGRTQIMVDACIAPIVQALNSAGIVTLGSCCGHGDADGTLFYERDGRALKITVEIGKHEERGLADALEEK